MVDKEIADENYYVAMSYLIDQTDKAVKKEDYDRVILLASRMIQYAVERKSAIKINEKIKGRVTNNFNKTLSMR